MLVGCTFGEFVLASVIRAVHGRIRLWTVRVTAEMAPSAHDQPGSRRRHRLPYLGECDPLTDAVIRASETTAVRYERDRPAVTNLMPGTPNGAVSVVSPAHYPHGHRHVIATEQAWVLGRQSTHRREHLLLLSPGTC
jgi:hypothetical protein